MDILDVFSWSLIPLTIRLAIPITLAAIGGTFSERSGVINIGLEGMMLMGAFGGVYGTYLSGNPWVGVFTALIMGALTGGIHAILSVKFKANQVVIGVGINMLAMGFTTVMTRAIWGTEGMSSQVKGIQEITIPLLNKIPVIGGIFTKQTPYLYLTFLIIFVGWYLMYKTKIGLRLRSIGDNPKAAKTAGVSIEKYRYFFVTLSGILSGLGGAYLSLVQNNLFVQNMTAGRGFIALAANIFGGWNPLGSFFASMIFAFAQAIRFNMFEVNIPNQFIQILPYLATLIILVGFSRKTRAPEALGEIDE